MTDLVTGEAVVLELRLAKLPSRALALTIDAIVQIAALFGVFLAFGLAGPDLDEAMAAAVTLVLIVAIIAGYPITFETLTRGRTLGKYALGLRVVRDDGGPIRFRHALMRGLTGFFELWALSGVIALVVSLASEKGKRLGDMLAGTVVVRERVPVQGGFVVPMPPPLAAWASVLELSRLPDDLALAARQYLSRRHQLTPAMSENMARRLATDVAQYVGRSAPPGTPAWAYLAAVVAERRNREMSRLMARHPQVGHYDARPTRGAATSGTAATSGAAATSGTGPLESGQEPRQLPSTTGFVPPA